MPPVTIPCQLMNTKLCNNIVQSQNPAFCEIIIIILQTLCIENKINVSLFYLRIRAEVRNQFLQYHAVDEMTVASESLYK